MTQAEALANVIEIVAAGQASMDLWRHTGDKETPAQGRFLVRPTSLRAPKWVWTKFATVTPDGAIVYVDPGDAPIPVNPPAPTLGASEAVIAFATALATRKTPIDVADVTALQRAASDFLATQDLPPPRDDWATAVKPDPVVPAPVPVPDPAPVVEETRG